MNRIKKQLRQASSSFSKKPAVTAAKTSLVVDLQEAASQAATMRRRSIENNPNLNRKLLDQLTSCDGHLSEDLKRSIKSQAPAVVPDLIAIMADDDLSFLDAPGEGRIPVYAIKMLEELTAIEAAPVMIELLSRYDWFDTIHSSSMGALKSFGMPILEQLLSAYSSADNDDYRDAIACVLSGLGCKDERIMTILVRTLENRPDFGALLFADYGDKSALAYLSRAFDECCKNRQPDPNDLREIQDAIEELGGELTDKPLESFNSAI